MFYKKENNGNWVIGKIINLAKAFDYEVLTKSNKQSKNGWEWHDTAPQEYLDWKEKQEIELN